MPRSSKPSSSAAGARWTVCHRGSTPERWNRFRNWIEQVYLSPWYIEVRRLRNVINYGSVLSAPLNWPPEAHCVSQWLASYDRVIETAEQGLALLLEPDA